MLIPWSCRAQSRGPGQLASTAAQTSILSIKSAKQSTDEVGRSQVSKLVKEEKIGFMMLGQLFCNHRRSQHDMPEVKEVFPTQDFCFSYRQLSSILFMDTMVPNIE